MKAIVETCVGEKGVELPRVKLIPETKADTEWLIMLMEGADTRPTTVILPDKDRVRFQSDLLRLQVAGVFLFPTPHEMVGIVQNLKEFSSESN